MIESVGSPPYGVEERGDRVVHGVWLLLVYHVAGIIDDYELRSSDILVEARCSPNIHDPVLASPDDQGWHRHRLDAAHIGDGEIEVQPVLHPVESIRAFGVLLMS